MARSAYLLIAGLRVTTMLLWLLLPTTSQKMAILVSLTETMEHSLYLNIQ